MTDRQVLRCLASTGCLSLLLVGAGCQGAGPLRGGSTTPPPLASTPGPTEGPTETSSRGEAAAEPVQSGSTINRLTSYVTGREPVNHERAKELYREADALFREAAAGEREAMRNQYDGAAKRFQRAAEAHPDSALEQDALFMAGESYFFADRLTKAEDAYSKLQKKHPRSRHNDRAAARLFAIGQYWVEASKAGTGDLLPINFTDATRPWTDTSGHGIRVFDQMRYDDPTGRLADDATMAAAVEYFRRADYRKADEFLTDLRETFPDSEHQFNAHLLGLRCKLESYAGPSYSGLVLSEAEKLVQNTRRRFPDKLSDPETRDLIARAAAEIEFRQAERLWSRARYREKRREYGAARVYWLQILEKYPDNPFADQSRDRLEALKDQPDMPPQRLAWLVDLLPAGEPAKPLMTSDGETFLR